MKSNFGTQSAHKRLEEVGPDALEKMWLDLFGSRRRYRHKARPLARSSSTS